MLRGTRNGFSLVEFLIGLGISCVISLICFYSLRLFIQKRYLDEAKEQDNLLHYRIKDILQQGAKEASALYGTNLILLHPRGDIIDSNGKSIANQISPHNAISAKSTAMTFAHPSTTTYLHVIDQKSNANSIELTLCGSLAKDISYKEFFAEKTRCFLLFSVDGALEVYGRLVRSENLLCRQEQAFRLTATVSTHPLLNQELYSAENLSFVSVVPLLDLYTLYIDTSKTLYAYHHSTSVKSPLAYNIEALEISTLQQTTPADGIFLAIIKSSGHKKTESSEVLFSVGKTSEISVLDIAM